MIIDLFGSLKENIVKRVKNPFLGTFSIVFIIKNWQLFYSLLVFDNESRESRITILENYISNCTFWGITGTLAVFLESTFWTLIVLIITGVLSNLT